LPDKLTCARSGKVARAWRAFRNKGPGLPGRGGGAKAPSVEDKVDGDVGVSMLPLDDNDVGDDDDGVVLFFISVCWWGRGGGRCPATAEPPTTSKSRKFRLRSRTRNDRRPPNVVGMAPVNWFP